MNGPLSETPKLIFASGFEGTTNVEYRGASGRPVLTGIDDETGFDWEAFFAGPDGTLVLDPIKGGENLDEYATTVEQRIGPDGETTDVLQLYVRDGERPVGEPPAPYRAEVDWKAPPDAAFGKYWMKIEDELSNMDDRWRVVQEWKGGERIFEANGNLINTWRMTLYVQRDGDELNYRFRAQDVSLDANGDAKRDTYFEKVVGVVPLNEWFLVETAYQKGTDDGYFWLSLNGETLLEFEGRTESKLPADDYTFWSPLKLYKSADDDAPSYHLYDNLEVWDGIPPDDVRAGFLAEGTPNDPPAEETPPAIPEPANPGINGTEGNDRLMGDANDNIIRGKDGDDRLEGRLGADTLKGGAGDDELRGGGDNDTLLGGDGDDWLRADRGNDLLISEAGNDRLDGGSGDDRLIGGAGDDSLSGGGGADIFVFTADSGADVVNDFTAGLDRLKFEDSGGMTDLSLSQIANDVVITHDGGSVTVSNVTLDTFSQADIFF